MFNVLITPQIWLQINHLTRLALKKQFNIKRTASPSCVTQHGVTRIESDGHSVEDLKALNAVSMQEYLGFKKIDPAADIHALLAMCVEKIERVGGQVEAEQAEGEDVAVELYEDAPLEDKKTEEVKELVEEVKKKPGRPKKINP